MNEQQNFATEYIGRNAFNVQSDLQRLYPQHLIQLLTINSIVTMDYRSDRIRIIYDNNNNVIDVRIG